MTEEAVYYRDVYKGVPFEIRHDRITGWESVDPRRTDKNNGILMCCGSDGDGEWAHVAYGEEQEKLVEVALANLRRSKLPTIIKEIRTRLGDVEWEKSVTAAGSPGAAAEDFITQMGTSNPRQWVDIFNLAGVSYNFTEVSVSGDERYQMLYFFEDGRKLNDRDMENYRDIHTRVRNWVRGEIYSAHTPANECYSFCDEAEPHLDKNCRIIEYVKEAIDESLNQKASNYTVEAEFATTQKVGNKNIWCFDEKRAVKFNVETKAAGKELAGFYNDHALVIARGPKER